MDVLCTVFMKVSFFLVYGLTFGIVACLLFTSNDKFFSAVGASWDLGFTTGGDEFVFFESGTAASIMNCVGGRRCFDGFSHGGDISLCTRTATGP